VSGDIPKPPDRPHEDECCHRGCSPCIMDYYEDALERWRERLRARGLNPDDALAAIRRVDPI